MNRELFLKLSFGSIGILASGKINGSNLINDEIHVDEEKYWELIRAKFPIHKQYINLAGAGSNPAPQITNDDFINNANQLNASPTLYYRLNRIRDEELRKSTKQRLAKIANGSPEEIALTRGTTESLNTIIFGIPLKKGDEVITTSHDYDTFISAWKQREKREGIKVKIVKVPHQPQSPEEIFNLISGAVTKSTKVIMVCDVDWINGHINPVKEICQYARLRGIQTVIDGAHSFAHIPVDLKDMGCDYYGTSLHKWLCATHGNGFLYVRKERISSLYPLYASGEFEADSNVIEKFESIGTILPYDTGIQKSLDLFDEIGFDKIQSRMRSLKQYWVSKLEGVNGFKIISPVNANYVNGFGYVKVKDFNDLELCRALRMKYNLITGCGLPRLNALNGGYPDFQGLSISTPVYVNHTDLDQFIEAITDVVSKGKF